MQKIEITCPERFIEALRFARSTNQMNSLIDALERLSSGNRHLRLHADFEKFSFTFDFTDERGFSMNGGLIYHGPLPDGNFGGGSSIQLCPKDGWSVHT